VIDTNAITDRHILDIRPNLGNDPGGFVPRNHAFPLCSPHPVVVIFMQITPAQTANLHLNHDLTGTWFRCREIPNLYFAIPKKNDTFHDISPTCFWSGFHQDIAGNVPLSAGAAWGEVDNTNLARNRQLLSETNL